MKYSQFLDELRSHAEPSFAAFQRKLIATRQTVLGVRTPVMRKLAKKYKDRIDRLFAFPDTYFEVTFIKLAAVSLLPYEAFLSYLPQCVERMDNWAMCDCFKAKCIRKNRKEFLPVLERLFMHGGEYYERYVLVTLLTEYIDETYLSVLENYLGRADVSEYYIHMAAAWLTAEVLGKYYETGIRWLQNGLLDAKTHNKAIQKARESYRLTNERKEYLLSLKIKTKA